MAMYQDANGDYPEDPFGPVDWRFDPNAQPGAGWYWDGSQWQQPPDAPYNSEEFQEFIAGTVPPYHPGPDQPAPDNPYGLEYWQSEQGIGPGQIFDENGQLRPGWTRTGAGYAYNGGVFGPGGVPPARGDEFDPNNPANNPTPTAAPTPTAPPRNLNTGPFGTRSAFDATNFLGSLPPSPFLAYPDYVSAGPAPDRTPIGAFTPRDASFEYDPFSYAPMAEIAPFTPGRFSYDPFTPTDWTQAEGEPGYTASRDQLKKQVEASAAHRGMVRSGMGIRDLYTNLDALAQQNMKSADDRRWRNYQTNRGNAFDAFQANEANAFNAYQTNKDTAFQTYGVNRAGAFDTWNANLGASKTKFDTEYGIDKDQYDRTAQDIEAGNAYRMSAFDRHAQDIDRMNNYRFNVADASFKDALARWTEQVRSLTQLAQPRD